MAVVGAASAEGVVAFRQQLQHQFLRFHAEAQQQTVVSVVGTEVVLVFEHPPVAHWMASWPREQA